MLSGKVSSIFIPNPKLFDKKKFWSNFFWNLFSKTVTPKDSYDVVGGVVDNVDNELKRPGQSLKKVGLFYTLPQFIIYLTKSVDFYL